MGEFMNCSSGRYAKGYAERRLRRYSRISPAFIASGVPLWRAFAGMRTLHPQWLDTLTLGGVTATR
jgi:hypothetical protein